MATVARDPDVVLVGAGLANSLIALELARSRPDIQLVLLDPSPATGEEEHTWCVFETDISAEAWRNLSSAFERTWPGYHVAFPDLERDLTTEYGCITGAGLRRAVDRAGVRRRTGRAVQVRPSEVVLEDGGTISARTVIDGRGARASQRLCLGFQKFVGLDVLLRRPHGLDRPIVMDATVRQLDGYRFLYVLPLAPDRLMIEDTRYADGAQLDAVALESAVLRYGRGRGWSIGEVARRERGVLPVALDGDPRGYFAEAEHGAAQVGMRGLFFHPTTGYSFPEATRVASLVAGHIDLGGERLAALLRDRAIKLWEEGGFYRLLNRMLFRAAAPEERYRVLEHFYRLPQPLIERFYAGRTTLADKARILSGKPPAPIWRALKAALPARPKAVHAS